MSRPVTCLRRPPTTFGAVALRIVLCVAALAAGGGWGDLLSAARQANREGRYEDAVQYYAAALEANPGLRSAERGIEEALRQRLPLWVEERSLARLPMDRTDVLCRTADDPSQVLILRHKAYVAPRPTQAQGKTQLKYEHCAGAYEQRDGRLRLAVVAHWAAGVPDTTALRVLRVFELCRVAAADMRIDKVYYETSRADPNYHGLSVLWLSAEGSLGGETIGRSVWLTGMGGEVASEDLVRVTAHEAGHTLIPAINGYQAPEETAEGHLGEILLPRYLLKQGIAILGEPAADAELGSSIAGKAARLAEAYQARSDDRDPGAGLDGMRVLIGGFLVLLERDGGAALGGLLGRRAADRAAVWGRLRAALAAPAAEETPAPSGR